MKYLNGLNYQKANDELLLLAEALYKNNETNDIDELNSTVKDIIEEYYTVFGVFPNTFALNKLSNVILKSVLRDKDRHKVSRAEYPLLSDTQIEYRQAKELYTDGEKELNYQYQKSLAKNGNYFKRSTQEKATI